MTNNKSVNMEHIYQHNIFIKKMCFTDKHTTYQGHHHSYDHVTMITNGKVKVKFSAVPEAGINETTKEYSAGDTFVTRAFRTHEITSLEPNTVVCCIHAVKDESGEIMVPATPKEELHNPDFKFKGHGEIGDITGKQIGRMAFTATLKEKHELMLKAAKEGTLKPGSEDMLLND